VILETGDLLKEASHIYRKVGFHVISNYEPYTNMQESVCMEKNLMEESINEGNDKAYNRLCLRPYRSCDAEVIVKWIGDEISFRKWCADRYESYPIKETDMNHQYNECMQTGFFYPMTAFVDQHAVGHLIMRFTDDEKMVIRFGFVILDNKKRGMGYGREMLRISLKYAFEILKVRKVTLGVFENNPAAYHCYQAAGFHRVEDEPDKYYEVLGQKWKCMEMEMTEAEYAGRN